MAGYEGMDPAFASALQRLAAATGGQISVNSGYRSVERQAQLFAAAVQKYGSEQAARRYVAPPGKSNHNKGVAADLHFNTPQARQLAHQLAPQFGLIFPMDYEPWHIEPVNARDGAHPQAYPLPVNGSLHPQDPMYSTVKAEPLQAAQLAHAIGAFDPKMLDLLEGGYPAGGDAAKEAPQEGSEPVQGQAYAGGGGQSGIGGNAESWIRQAMAITGVGEDWYPGLMRRMMQESGGRNIPQNSAVNDINMRTGNPAFGPMQVIRTTFEANKLPGYENWKDPLHSTVAAIRYIQRHPNYGHPDKLNPNTGY